MGDLVILRREARLNAYNEKLGRFTTRMFWRVYSSDVGEEPGFFLFEGWGFKPGKGYGWPCTSYSSLQAKFRERLRKHTLFSDDPELDKRFEVDQPSPLWQEAARKEMQGLLSQKPDLRVTGNFEAWLREVKAEFAANGRSFDPISRIDSALWDCIPGRFDDDDDDGAMAGEPAQVSVSVIERAAGWGSW